MGEGEAAAAPSNVPAPEEAAPGVEEAGPTGGEDAVAMEVEEESAAAKDALHADVVAPADVAAPADMAAAADVAAPAGKPKQSKPHVPAQGELHQVSLKWNFLCWRNY